MTGEPNKDASSMDARPLRHWTPNELARRALDGLPVIGKRRHSAAEAIEELRVRALEAPHGR